jgi:hypothetical protein
LFVLGPSLFSSILCIIVWSAQVALCQHTAVVCFGLLVAVLISTVVPGLLATLLLVPRGRVAAPEHEVGVPEGAALASARATARGDSKQQLADEQTVDAVVPAGERQVPFLDDSLPNVTDVIDLVAVHPQ